MTPSEVAWWTPLWKRTLLLSFFVAIATWGHYDSDTTMTAAGWFLAGFTMHQMFIAFGWTKPMHNATLS